MMGRVPKVTIVRAPNGVAHTKDSLRRMALLARKGAESFLIRSAATRIVHHVPGKNRRGELQALYTWVRDNIRYRGDPDGLEWLQAPDITLQERAGDCDDITILLWALCMSLGHKVQPCTVGPTRERQGHVYLRVCDGREWVTLDPVLEPEQPTTAPRADLGMFGRTAPGAVRKYDAKGSPMGNPLWPHTPQERSQLLRPRIVRIYRGRDAAGPRRPGEAPMGLDLWRNAYDPGDLSGGGALGFGILTAIGSAVGGGIKAIRAVKKRKKKAKAAKAKKAKAAKAAKADAAHEGYGPAPSVKDLAPLFKQATGVAREGLRALQASQRDALRAVTAIAGSAQAGRNARELVSAKARARVLVQRSDAPAKSAKAKRAAAPAARRQKWDPKRKRWIVYQKKGAALGHWDKGMGIRVQLEGVRPLVSVGPGGIPTIAFTMGAAASSAPAGYDPTLARQLAPVLSANIKTKAGNYDRKLAKRFQTAAGIVADGLYGGGSKGALRYYGVASPPPARFAPTAERTYQPPATTAAAEPVSRQPAPTRAAGPSSTPKPAPAPSSPTRKQKAQAAIGAVRSYIAKSNAAPRVALPQVLTYQRAAGLSPDGKYGPQTRASAARDLGVAESTLPRSAYEPKPAAAAKPTATRPAPRPAPRVVVAKPAAKPVDVFAPKPSTAAPAARPGYVTTDRAPTRKEQARAVVDYVRAAIARDGKPPSTSEPGIAAYQNAAGLSPDGKYGPRTREAAAKDLGVAVSSLPPSAYDKRAPAKRKPSPKPAPKKEETWEPVDTAENDPGFPEIPSAGSSSNIPWGWLALGYLYYRRNKAA